MILQKIKSVLKNQKGFTLIEVIAVLAISGLIGAGVTMATVQMISQGGKNTDYTAASRHTQNAIHWISRDTHMAQVIDPNGASGFPLNLSWVEWDNSSHQVVFSFDGDELKRTYSVDGGESSETLVARYINQETEMTNCVSDNGVLSLTMTATVGTGENAVSVTKVRDITCRTRL